MMVALIIVIVVFVALAFLWAVSVFLKGLQGKY
jgi:hypothetical protein